MKINLCVQLRETRQQQYDDLFLIFTDWLRRSAVNSWELWVGCCGKFINIVKSVFDGMSASVSSQFSVSPGVKH